MFTSFRKLKSSLPFEMLNSIFESFIPSIKSGLTLLNAKEAVVCAVQLTRAARGLAAAGK
jgi:hypothetical protein